ncbi:unnamed protein product [Closterium sp. Yama58-4]|nr:unnamed protein product [Closterium sp. Yama58-4]
MLAHANNVHKMNLRRRLSHLKVMQPQLDMLQSQLSILVPTFPCPKEERVGVWADGRKWLCNMKTFLPDNPVVYSIGSGGEYSFEKDMFFKFPLTRPLTFDPFLDPSLSSSMQALSFLRLLPIGLAGAGVIERARVDRPGVQFMTVGEVMAANNHSYVDVLKVDCDGCEEGLVYDIKPGRREGGGEGVGDGVGVGSGGGRGEGGGGGEGREEEVLEEFSRVKPFGDPAIGQILIDLHHVNNPSITLPMDVRLRTLVLVNIAAIVERADEALLPAVYNEVGQAFHASPQALGTLTLVRALVQALTCPLAPWLAHWMARVRVIAVGAFTWAIATLGVGIATNYYEVAAWRGLNGVGLALVIPAIQSLVADSASNSTRGMAFGWLQFVTNFGNILGFTLGISLACYAFFGLAGWRMAFIIVTVVSLGLAAVLWLFAHDPPPTTVKSIDALTGLIDDSGAQEERTVEPLLSEDHGLDLKQQQQPHHLYQQQQHQQQQQQQQQSQANESTPLQPTSSHHRHPSSPSPHSPHSHPHPSPLPPTPLSAPRSSSTFLSDVLKVLRIRTFQLIIAQGVVGSFPWAAGAFFPMWFELLGFSHASTAVLLSVFTVACSLGGLFGGWFGDVMARRWPDGGRLVCAQISAGSAVVLSTVLLRVVPHSPEYFGVYLMVLTLMGFLISWNAAGTNNPIFAEIVPERLRTDIYALDRTFEMSIAAFAPPTVGYLAQAWFGYIPPSPEPADTTALGSDSGSGVSSSSSCSRNSRSHAEMAADAKNAEALSLGLFWTMAVPFAICCACYGWLYWTYPKDRDRVRAEAAAEAREDRSMASFSRLHDKVFSQQHQQQHYRDHLLGLNAFQRHQKFVHDYVRFYGRSAPSSAAPAFKTDLDVLRESYRFIRSDADDAEGTWEQRLAKRYYDKLFKEYCVADMSRYKENKIGLRWRTHAEVLQGKGQFVCGTKGCDNREGLHSYEVNFAYHEAGQKKQALVKLRVCAKHAYQLNYRKEKELERQRAAEERERERAERERRHTERKKRKTRRDSDSDSSNSSQSDTSDTSDSEKGAAESDSDEGDDAKRHKRRRSERARKEGRTGKGERHSVKEEEAKLRKEKREHEFGKRGGSTAGGEGRISGARGESGAGGAGEGTEAGRDGAVCGAADISKTAGSGHEVGRAGQGHGPEQGHEQGHGQGSGSGLADGMGKNVVVQGGTLPANEDVWQQPAMAVEPSREEEFDEYFQGMTIRRFTMMTSRAETTFASPRILAVKRRIPRFLLSFASASKSRREFRFCIDRGGTFTDIYAEVPGDPPFRVVKLLSEDPLNYDDAPREGIRRILEEVTGEKIPRNAPLPTERIDWIRMGTTVATNALLERAGERTALCVTRGFPDLLRIGNQARPRIFDLTARRASLLYEEVVEVEERAQVLPGEEAQGEGLGKGNGGGEAEGGGKEGEGEADGGEEGGKRTVRGVSGELVRVLVPLNIEKTRAALEKVLARGIKSLAIAFLHSYTFPNHERAVAALAREMGFNQVSASSDLVPMVRIVPRGHTACVDAYLTPAIRTYVGKFLAGFDSGLADVAVSFMRSDGGLTPAQAFTGYQAILSGPAGGVVGFARTTFEFEDREMEGLEGLLSDVSSSKENNQNDNKVKDDSIGAAGTAAEGALRCHPVIGFDMGGTSTDVSRYAGGAYEQVLETTTAGITIQAPQLDINTVAAGGGSRLFFESGMLRVGPASVGAHPGPVCYRKGGQLAVTDANLLLGRVLPEYFPAIFGPNEDLPLDEQAAREAMAELANEVNRGMGGGQGEGDKEGEGKEREGEGQESLQGGMSVEEVAMGFIRVANEAMCRPIRELTEARGHETSTHVLACFGGAGPQHACAIARSLGISTVFVHRLCGILSAYGMGLADRVVEMQEPAAEVCSNESLPRVLARAARMEEQVRVALCGRGSGEGGGSEGDGKGGKGEGGEGESGERGEGRREDGEGMEGERTGVWTQVLLNLRYDSTDTVLMVEAPPTHTLPSTTPSSTTETAQAHAGTDSSPSTTPASTTPASTTPASTTPASTTPASTTLHASHPAASFDFQGAFKRRFEREFGFDLQGDRRVLIDDVRVKGVAPSGVLQQTAIPRAGGSEVGDAEGGLVAAGAAEAEGVQHRVYFEGGWRDTAVFRLEKLRWGHVVRGPAVILNGTSTVVVEPGCSAGITKYGNIVIAVGHTLHESDLEATAEATAASAVRAGAGAGAGEATVAALPAAPAAPSSPAVPWDVVRLSIFGNRFMGIAEQMGRTLQRTAISTNIKERLDFSCALFSPDGGLVANAPHVPVHLGAMSDTVRWQLEYWGRGAGVAEGGLKEGDVLVTNHPCAGGSHLPDITVVTPVFREGRIIFFVASRGHHSEIGGSTPGSMPPFSRSIWEEGAAIRTMKLVKGGVFQEEAIRAVLLEGQVLEGVMAGGAGLSGSEQVGGRTVRRVPGTRRIEDNLSDLRAQVAANQRGIELIGELVEECGLETVLAYMGYVQVNAEQVVRRMLTRTALKHLESQKRASQEQQQASQKASLEQQGAADKALPTEGDADGNGDADGQQQVVVLQGEDRMDDGSLIRLRISIHPSSGSAHFDFTGTSPEVYGNWNAPTAVTTAAIIYCLRCLVDSEIPLNQGCLAPVRITLPLHSLLSPSDTAAVVGGNVLTSQRVTDIILATFAAAANSQGCMNNLTFGDGTFGYYETIAGGVGAGPTWQGEDGVQSHMTNTRITDPEVLERRYPVLMRRFRLRQGSGGSGERRGGHGVERELEFLRPATVSMLSERRVLAPNGGAGGGCGARGLNLLRIARDGRVVNLGGKASVGVERGDTLLVCTPGGGGWGMGGAGGYVPSAEVSWPKFSCEEQGWVGEFEGELGYYLPKHLRRHPERVKLATRPLGCPLDASRLPNVFMGYFEHLPLRKPWPPNFYGTPIEPQSDISCVASGAISGGGSSDGSNGSPNGSPESSFIGANPTTGTGNVTSALAESVLEESVSGGVISGKSIAGGIFANESDWVKKLRCDGPPCPSFGSCTARFPNLEKWRHRRGWAPFDETCTNRKDFTQHDASALQMMRLEDVYVTANGVNLNRTHVFVRNGCWRFPGMQAKYEATHVVQELPAVFNWAHQPANNFYHFLVELVPLFLVAAPLMASTLRHVPVLVGRKQVHWYEQLGAPLIGIQTDQIRLLPIFDYDLFHAHVVYQPIYQDCNHPSRPLWRLLRRRHLLHPSGIPLFNPDWTYRNHRPLSLPEARSFPSDWVVVLAKRPEGQKRSMVNFRGVEAEVVRRFGRERVVVFNGSLPILQARALLSRARFYIASLGAALTNMIFMPEQSSVLEIRPEGCDITVFNALASACSLRYHLVLTKGDWGTPIVANVTSVAQVLDSVQARMRKEDGGDVGL